MCFEKDVDDYFLGHFGNYGPHLTEYRGDAHSEQNDKCSQCTLPQFQ
jgi:hypothetical protein